MTGFGLQHDEGQNQVDYFHARCATALTAAAAGPIITAFVIPVKVEAAGIECPGPTNKPNPR